MERVLERMPSRFVEALREERYHEAATDAELEQRWRREQDAFARALLILSAAHLHIERGNDPGARAKFERAVPYLRERPGDAFADVLIAHAQDSIRRLESGSEVVPLIEVLEERR